MISQGKMKLGHRRISTIRAICRSFTAVITACALVGVPVGPVSASTPVAVVLIPPNTAKIDVSSRTFRVPANWFVTYSYTCPSNKPSFLAVEVVKPSDAAGASPVFAKVTRTTAHSAGRWHFARGGTYRVLVALLVPACTATVRVLA
jgi:hypothetical protein